MRRSAGALGCRFGGANFQESDARAALIRLPEAFDSDDYIFELKMDRFGMEEALLERVQPEATPFRLATKALWLHLKIVSG